eukprot:jgi/Botrbrau1/22952/Bobra.0030s0026.1
MTAWEALPRELVERIFSCLDTDTLRTLRLVSKLEKDAATASIQHLRVDSAETRDDALYHELSILSALTHLELVAFNPSSLPLLSVPLCLRLLQRLDLDWQDATQAGDADLFTHLAAATVLTFLRFDSYVPVQQVAQFLQRCPGLVELELRLFDMDDSLAEAVSAHKRLERLSCFLQRDVYFDQASALRYLMHVPKLQALSGVALTSTDMALCISSIQSLTRLHISRLETHPDILAALTWLDVLEIDTNCFFGIPPQQTSFYPRVLMPLTQLQRLVLGGSLDAPAVAETISAMTQLTELYVYGRMPVWVLARCTFPLLRHLRMEIAGDEEPLAAVEPAGVFSGIDSLKGCPWASLAHPAHLDHLRLRVDAAGFHGLRSILPKLTALTALLLNIDHGGGTTVDEGGGEAPPLDPNEGPGVEVATVSDREVEGRTADSVPRERKEPDSVWMGESQRISAGDFLRAMPRLATLQLRGVLDEQQWDKDVQSLTGLTGLTRLVLAGSNPDYPDRLAFTSLLQLTCLTRLKTIVLLNPWSRITTNEEKMLKESLEESSYRMGWTPPDLLLGYPRSDA